MQAEQQAAAEKAALAAEPDQARAEAEPPAEAPVQPPQPEAAAAAPDTLPSPEGAASADPDMPGDGGAAEAEQAWTDASVEAAIREHLQARASSAACFGYCRGCCRAFTVLWDIFTPSLHKVVDSPECMCVQDALAAGTEGLMLKALTGPGSTYQPSKRSNSWLKIKRCAPRPGQSHLLMGDIPVNSSLSSWPSHHEACACFTLV